MAMGASPHFMLSDSSSKISKVELLLPEEKIFHFEFNCFALSAQSRMYIVHLYSKVFRLQFSLIQSSLVQLIKGLHIGWPILGAFFQLFEHSKPYQTSSPDARQLLSFNHIYFPEDPLMFSILYPLLYRNFHLPGRAVPEAQWRGRRAILLPVEVLLL